MLEVFMLKVFRGSVTVFNALDTSSGVLITLEGLTGSGGALNASFLVKVLPLSTLYSGSLPRSKRWMTSTPALVP